MALARLAGARLALDGASDHLVSEALYLSDPDGNGIEIYRDRPRAEWPGPRRGLQMATLPLDLDSVLSELGDRGGVAPHVPADTRIGHVHLQVSDLDAGGAVLLAACSASTSPSVAIPGRCSSRPAATTTTSGSTPGIAPARRRRAPGAIGLEQLRGRAADAAPSSIGCSRRVREAGIEVEAPATDDRWSATRSATGCCSARR